MQIRENISLKPFNTFGIESRARYFSVFESVDQLGEMVEWTQHQSITRRLILGGGSNILLTGDFDGMVLKNEIKGIDIVKEDDHYVYVKVGGGENWHELVLYCLRQNFAGMENLALIPGNAGASPIQNIGAYGVELKDIFHELEAFHLSDRSFKTFSVNDCQFGYRESVFKKQFKDQFVITSVTYRLHRQPHLNISYGAISQELERMQVKDLTIQSVAQAVINIRSSKLPDPTVVGNAGSFFKNPQVSPSQFETLKDRYPEVPSFPGENGQVKMPAGWLIEQCGWKGFREGDAGCYPKQALVLVNYGNASGDDIYRLSERIIRSVKEKFNIQLDREVNVI